MVQARETWFRPRQNKKTHTRTPHSRVTLNQNVVTQPVPLEVIYILLVYIWSIYIGYWPLSPLTALHEFCTLMSHLSNTGKMPFCFLGVSYQTHTHHTQCNATQTKSVHGTHPTMVVFVTNSIIVFSSNPLALWHMSSTCSRQTQKSNRGHKREKNKIQKRPRKNKTRWFPYANSKWKRGGVVRQEKASN